MSRIRVEDLPESVLKRVSIRGAERWLAELPALVSDLEHEWSMTVGRVLSGGSEALVAEVSMADGEPAVVKVLMPGEGASAVNEIAALRLADGEGCARLYRADEERGAMLLERLGKPLEESTLSQDERLDVMVETAMRLWRPAAGLPFPSGAEKGLWLADFIKTMWEQLGRPCSEQAVQHALQCVERRIVAHDEERSVLVHGDIHAMNTLEAKDGYKLIDPDGLAAEAEYDLGVILRQDRIDSSGPDPLLRLRRLAGRTGTDATAIWEWSVVERLSTALVCTNIGYEPLGREMLASAEAAALVGGER